MLKEGSLVLVPPNQFIHADTDRVLGEVWADYGDASDVTVLDDQANSFEAGVYADDELIIVSFHPLNEHHILVWSRSSWHAITGKAPEI